MASAQVLPTSRKQEHLEAGKRKLEEFRKKKAAERAKKASSVSQPQASEGRIHDEDQLETDRVRVTDSDGGVTSAGPDKAVVDLSLLKNNDENKALKLAQQSQRVSLSDKRINSRSLENDLNSSLSDLAQTYSNGQETSGSAGSVGFSNSHKAKDVNNDFTIYSSGQGRLQHESMSNQYLGLLSQASQDYDRNPSKSGSQGMEESLSKENDSFPKVSTLVNSGPLHDFVTNVSTQNSVSTLFHTKPGNIALGNDHSFHSFSEDFTHLSSSMGGSASDIGLNMLSSTNFSDPVSFNTGEGKPSKSASSLASLHGTPFKNSEYSGSNFDAGSSFNHVPVSSASNKFTLSKSRSSFLDTLNVPRASSGTLFQRTEPEKESFISSSSLNSMDVLGSSPAQKPSMEKETIGPFSKSNSSNALGAFDYLGNPTVSMSDGDMVRLGNENSKEKQQGFYSTKYNEDFAALEQYIEDLTQEKFTLQRSLEASRALAESLAAENSSLTDSYNQQRSVVNQLKSEMEMLQEEIKAQLVELESFRNEYANVRLECNAADERAKILASEVIGLEEKALRLRSSELKLERQLENSQSEISSYKKKMYSLEKERQDLQSTIEALQEEKKVMQSKLRKASGSVGKSVDFNRTATSSKDVSTSTEDLAIADSTLDNSDQETHDDSSLPGIDDFGSSLLPESGQLALEGLTVKIPPDQTRMIHNINTLISELALEKEELMQALSSELGQSSRLKELNNELSQKLEAQTQRLELVTAQNMANENVSIRQPDSAITHDHTAYADEGDEVVERVLGWIMKLFPGGPSRRRTSKLL